MNDINHEWSKARQLLDRQRAEMAYAYYCIDEDAMLDCRRDYLLSVQLPVSDDRVRRGAS